MQFTAEDIRCYQTVLGQILQSVDEMPELIRDFARKQVLRYSGRDFFRLMTLLPVWLKNCLPVSQDNEKTLARASFCMSWYYHVQDDIVDQQLATTELLSGHWALLHAVEAYSQLGVTKSSTLSRLREFVAMSGEAHAVEIATRFTDPSEIDRPKLDLLNKEFLVNRVAPWYFTPIAQFTVSEV